MNELYKQYLMKAKETLFLFQAKKLPVRFVRYDACIGIDAVLGSPELEKDLGFETTVKCGIIDLAERLHLYHINALCQAYYAAAYVEEERWIIGGLVKLAEVLAPRNIRRLNKLFEGWESLAGVLRYNGWCRNEISPRNARELMCGLRSNVFEGISPSEVEDARNEYYAGMVPVFFQYQIWKEMLLASSRMDAKHRNLDDSYVRSGGWEEKLRRFEEDPEHKI